MSSREARDYCRVLLLQLPAGVVDVFELRLSGPPYRQMYMCFDDIPIETRTAVAVHVQREPLDCLPFACRRLLHVCPSTRDLLTTGAQILRALGLGTFPAIDFTERSHAAMRIDVASSGSGCRNTPSAHRTMCRQAVELHTEIKGAHPLRSSTTSLDKAAPVADEDGGVMPSRG